MHSVGDMTDETKKVSLSNNSRWPTSHLGSICLITKCSVSTTSQNSKLRGTMKAAELIDQGSTSCA